MRDMSLVDLEKVTALQILAYVSVKRAATRTDLRRNIKGVMETIYSSLKVLDELGLIEEKESASFPFPKEVYLTEKGRRIAEHLVEIEKILKG